ncbi:hypothetical protein GF342_04510 [Candidatus Woesearchaeota archaeon]|nr:hypothetical protein [Candidatus Woesearchaeota archaeon]
MKRVDRFAKEGQRGPQYRGRISVFEEGTIPFRAYFAEFGFEEAFGTQNPEEKAEEHLRSLFRRNEFLKGDFALASLWGLDAVPQAEVYLYSAYDDWHGNHCVRAYVFKGGLFAPDERAIMCEDMAIVLGAEGFARRLPGNAELYMRNAPSIPGLCHRTVLRED